MLDFGTCWSIVNTPPMEILTHVTLICGQCCNCCCVLALHGFASQTQFSNSSADLHYSYGSEPADRVTLRHYSQYTKVPFAAKTRNTVTFRKKRPTVQTLMCVRESSLDIKRIHVKVRGWMMDGDAPAREMQKVAGGHKGKLTWMWEDTTQHAYTFTLRQRGGHPWRPRLTCTRRFSSLGGDLPKLVWRPRWGFTAGLKGRTNKRRHTKDDTDAVIEKTGSFIYCLPLWSHLSSGTNPGSYDYFCSGGQTSVANSLIQGQWVGKNERDFNQYQSFFLCVMLWLQEASSFSKSKPPKEVSLSFYSHRDFSALAEAWRCSVMRVSTDGRDSYSVTRSYLQGLWFLLVSVCIIEQLTWDRVCHSLCFWGVTETDQMEEKGEKTWMLLLLFSRVLPRVDTFRNLFFFTLSLMIWGRRHHAT